MDSKYTNDTMFLYYKGFDENLACLTQKTEDKKVIKEITFVGKNFTFTTHRVNVTEL